MARKTRKNEVDRQQILQLVKSVVGEPEEERAGAVAGLAGLELQVLELLSIIYAPASKSAIASCLNRCGIRNQEGRQFSSTSRS